MNPRELQEGKLYVLDLSVGVGDDDKLFSQIDYDRLHGKVVIYLNVSEPAREPWEYDYNTWEFLLGEKIIKLTQDSVLWNVLPASFISRSVRRDLEPC